jgi:hypothetical protein
MDGGLRQTTVYGNRVTLYDGAPTAMLLPVPVSAANAGTAECGIQVYDMTGAGPLFETLDKLFPSAFSNEYTDAHTMSFSRSQSAAAPLAVRRSGSYRYTIVPSLADFGRLQHEVFGLNPSSPLAAMFAKYYSVGFAFLVCIIDASAAFAPIAYQHDKHTSGNVFVPTRHYHGSGAEEASADDWDHQIISVGCVGEAAGKQASASEIYRTHASLRSAGSIELAQLLLEGGVRLPFRVPRIVHQSVVHRRTIKGAHPNDDIWLVCEAAMRMPGVCTFNATGTHFAEQDWYTCATCTAAGALTEAEGACLACVQACHAGHDVVFAGRTPFFCDCGARGAAHGCVART